jgi:guanylate kinase
VLCVISGPSGVGKSTLIERLRKHDRCRLAVSATTRAPRPGEIDGVHYRFVSQVEFDAMRDGGLLLEWAVVHGSLYGTPAAEIGPWLDQGWTVIVDVDVHGFRAIRKRLPAIGVFVEPPSIEHLDARLRGRANEHDARLDQRLRAARAEIEAAPEYDHRIVNEDVNESVKELERILGLKQASPAAPGRKETR